MMCHVKQIQLPDYQEIADLQSAIWRNEISLTLFWEIGTVHLQNLDML